MERIHLSVLDRLIDADPRNQAEAPLTHAQSARVHREAVRRDLEWLLNTRRIAELPPESLQEVNRSVYIYGLPDVSAWSLSNPLDRKKLLRELYAVVRLFEPRLAGARITPVEEGPEKSRTLRFRIEAMLVMDPAPEHVAFDTLLQLTTGGYEVRDAG